MKFSFTLRPARPLNRAEAWGCLLANLALPGSGSLAAGRVVGCFQFCLTALGLVVTLVTGFRFILWWLSNWERLNQPSNDALASLLEVWLAVRWPLAGVAVFLLAFLWALLTSLQILSRAAKNPEAAPPKLV